MKAAPTQMLKLWLAFLMLSIILSACNDTATRPYSIKLKTGDQSGWSKGVLNDSDWQRANGFTGKRVAWLRFHLFLDSSTVLKAPLAVQVTALGSYDAWWDGQLIGRNGKVGNSRAHEVPGKHHTFLLLPDSLKTQGHHVLALRVSNYYNHSGYSFFNIRVDSYRRLLQKPVRSAAFMALLGGAFIIGTIYYLLLYINHRHERLFLIFALICGLFFLLMLAEYLPAFWSYRYDVQTIRLEVISILTLGIAFYIPYFVNRWFKILPGKRFNGAMLGILLAIYILNFKHYDHQAQMLSLTMGIAVLILAILAVIRKAEGAGIILAAVLLSMAGAGVLYFDYSLYLSFGFLLLAMFYLMSKRSKEIDTAYRQTLLLSERLKIELLKKSLQPHFLMNTLTSLIDWVELSPAEGVKMIHAIAKEFEILGRMAEKQLVSLSEEIDLCKTHLEIMHYRKGIRYVWRQEDVKPEETLPPAILHTILENGITHSIPLPEGLVIFSLICRREADNVRTYTLNTIARNRKKEQKIVKGTGFRYIEARLQENYDSNWELTYGPTGDGWQTVIKIL